MDCIRLAPMDFLCTKVQFRKASLHEALWHERIGHHHVSMVQHIAYSLNKTITPNSYLEVCGACQLGKSHRVPFNHTYYI